MVARTGFEPVISALRGRRPKPLDERAYIKQMYNEISFIIHFALYTVHFSVASPGFEPGLF